MQALTQSRKLLDQYLAQFPKERLSEHPCPHCNHIIGALKPEQDQVFDSLISCPDCDQMFYRTVGADGSVQTRTPEMNALQLSIVQHSLGVDKNGQGNMYRNHFCAGADDALICRELVSMGYMVEHPGTPLSGGDPVFTVTEIGKRAMLNQSRKPN